MGIFKELFIWWDGNTIGNRVWTWRQGRKVGEDEFGNRYYEQRRGIFEPVGKPRRWVVYNGEAEASMVPAEWHGWLHYTVDELPSESGYKPKHWEKSHRPNMTGTPEAYRPRGSMLAGGQRPKVTGDYEPWTPE